MIASKGKLLLLPGDGIGPEVVAEAVRVLDWFEAHAGVRLERSQALVGGAAIEAEGAPISAETMQLAADADAILFGAVGGPRWDSLPFDETAVAGLLRLRKELDLFGNLRPAICFDALAEASSLKRELVAGLDILIVRELTGGVYFGQPRGIATQADGTRKAVDTQVYTTPEIERAARLAFDLARQRGRRVHSVEKANVMHTGVLWRETVQRVHDAEYPDVELQHMFADNCAMQLLRQPKQFDVIVTDNLFGDILSDVAAMLTGSLGMLPSASLGPARPGDGKRCALYEPIHGSAPDIAGQGIANPLATILSLAMALRYSFSLPREAELIERAVESVLDAGIRTGDIMQPGMQRVGTREMGDAVVAALTRLNA